MCEGLGASVGDGRAHALRTRYHDHFEVPEFPVPVESIAEDLLGLAVLRADMECSGMLLPAERRLIVNASEPETRQRFTVAHELGHWICQYLDGTTLPVYCRADEVDESARKLEREANIFAAELLMPEEAVRDAVGVDGAKALGVSELAFAWRLYSFNLGPKPIT